MLHQVPQFPVNAMGMGIPANGVEHDSADSGDRDAKETTTALAAPNYLKCTEVLQNRVVEFTGLSELRKMC